MKVNNWALWLCFNLSLKYIHCGIIKELKKNQQIDWYLQAELAYNKCFGESDDKDQKNKAKRIRFIQHLGFSFDEITPLTKSNR